MRLRPVLSACVLLASAWAAERVDYPPATRLKDRVLVARRPEGGGDFGCTLARNIERGYEAISFPVQPGDPARGSRWVVYDTAQRRITTIYPDLNTLCGEPTRQGRLGQRAYVTSEGPSGGWLIGTGPPLAQGDFPGGHVIRNGKSVGSVEPGWAVVAFAWQRANAKGKHRKPGEMGAVALARSPDGQRCRLYFVDTDDVVPLGIEGGQELWSFRTEGDSVSFPTVNRLGIWTWMKKVLDANEPPDPVPGPPQKADEEVKGFPPCVWPRFRGQWVMWEQWRGTFRAAKREDLIERAGLRDGFACFAREGNGPNEPAEVFLHRPASGEPVKLCSLAPFEGQTLQRVCWLRLLGSGDIAVLAESEKATVLEVYENPLLATICAQWNALMNQAFAGEPTVKARYAGSLYDLSEYADRAFDPLLVASDGRAYFGTMPHHSSESSPIFAFDPKGDKLILLGDLARLAGVRLPGTVPHMMHSSPFEMHGKVYFTGEDPHYGGWGFPLAPDEKPPQYQGSPILEYDLKTGKARGLGIPLPGHPGLFRIAGDPRRNVLYVRRGYTQDHYGPLTWFALRLDANGNITGEPRKLPFEVHPYDLLVAADSTIFCSIPEPKAHRAFIEKRERREKTDGIVPQCEIHRLDPELTKAERVATVEGTWDIQWAPWRHGKPTAIGVGGRFVYRLNLGSGAIEKLVPWPRGLHGGECPMAVSDGRLYSFQRINPKARGGRTMGVYSLDLKTGEARFHGLIVDEAGRRPKDINHFACLPDGRILAVGTVYGLPTDRHSMPRYRDGEPYRLDCAAFLIDTLPPGVVLEK